jgi:polygalacturonase
MKPTLILLTALLLAPIAALRASPSADSRVVIASEAGAKLDSNVETGGGTDDTALIQSILDRAPKLGSLRLIVDGAILVKGLKIHSNTIIECLTSDCGFFLADHSDQPIIINADPSLTERRDRNLAFIGGTYNGNGAKQAHDVPGRGWMTGFALFGVENVTFRDVTIKNATTFAVHMRWTPKVGQDGSLIQTQNNDPNVKEATSAQSRSESQSWSRSPEGH